MHYIDIQKDSLFLLLQFPIDILAETYKNHVQYFLIQNITK